MQLRIPNPILSLLKLDIDVDVDAKQIMQAASKPAGVHAELHES